MCWSAPRATLHWLPLALEGKIQWRAPPRAIGISCYVLHASCIRFNRDNDPRSPSDALASRILLTSPSPRKHKGDEPALPFTHAKNKSPLPIFKTAGKRPSPGKAGLNRDQLPQFGAELGELGDHGPSLLDEVDLEHCYYGWNKASKGDDDTPFAADKLVRARTPCSRPHPCTQAPQRVLKRKLFSPSSNTARTLDEVFPLGDTDLLGAENHAPTGSINVTPQRPPRGLERELSLQVYVNQSTVSPAGAGSPLLPHHAGPAATTSPMGVSLPVPLLLHSPEPREPHGKGTMHAAYPSLLGPRVSVGQTIPPLLNVPPPPIDPQQSPLWAGNPPPRGRRSPSSSDEVPLDDSSDEDYTESPVRGRARGRSQARRKKGGLAARDSFAIQQAKAAPARRGMRDLVVGGTHVHTPPRSQVEGIVQHGGAISPDTSGAWGAGAAATAAAGRQPARPRVQGQSIVQDQQ